MELNVYFLQQSFPILSHRNTLKRLYLTTTDTCRAGLLGPYCFNSGTWVSELFAWDLNAPILKSSFSHFIITKQILEFYLTYCLKNYTLKLNSCPRQYAYYFILYVTLSRSRCSAVSVATRLQAGRSGVGIPAVARNDPLL